MYVMIDNYDSFVYNLEIYLRELKKDVYTIRNDQVTLGELERLYREGELEGVILSPGPKSPADSGRCREILRGLAGRVPILGVCLGHQIIGYEFGAVVEKGVRPMHGKVTMLHHDGEYLFEGLPRSYRVTRYHSLVVREEELPSCLVVTARAEDGSIQGLRHRYFPIYGVQFHPEAVLTEHGHALLKNFTEICEKWWESHDEKNVG